jgi:hypothetical protein
MNSTDMLGYLTIAYALQTRSYGQLEFDNICGTLYVGMRETDIRFYISEWQPVNHIQISTETFWKGLRLDVAYCNITLSLGLIEPIVLTTDNRSVNRFQNETLLVTISSQNESYAVLTLFTNYPQSLCTNYSLTNANESILLSNQSGQMNGSGRHDFKIHLNGSHPFTNNTEIYSNLTLVVQVSSGASLIETYIWRFELIARLEPGG